MGQGPVRHIVTVTGLSVDTFFLISRCSTVYSGAPKNFFKKSTDRPVTVTMRHRTILGKANISHHKNHRSTYHGQQNTHWSSKHPLYNHIYNQENQAKSILGPAKPKSFSGECNITICIVRCDGSHTAIHPRFTLSTVKPGVVHPRVNNHTI